MKRSRQFAPGVIDYDGRMSASYQSGRALSAEAASIWTAVVAPFVQPRKGFRILDLGAGTGRFSTLFARVFEAQVVGAAESIPLRSSCCDLVWISHVWHHIRERPACALHREPAAI